MVQAVTFSLGAGLGLLWLAGLGSSVLPFWLSWLNLAAAVWAFVVSGIVGEYSSRATRVGAPMALALGLLALWVAGISANPNSWLAWWDFAFAGLFVLVGLSAGSEISSSSKINIPKVRKAPFVFRRKDSVLQAEIEERLLTTWELDASEIVVSVHGGIVTLTGHVDGRRARHLGQEVAAGVFGVVKIENQLESRAA